MFQSFNTQGLGFALQDQLDDYAERLGKRNHIPFGQSLVIRG
jgi:hypothetical protein